MILDWANVNHGLLNAGEYRETLSWAIRKGHQNTRKKREVTPKAAVWQMYNLQFTFHQLCVCQCEKKNIVIMAVLSLTSSYANWANKCVFTETSLDGELTSQLFTVKLGRGKLSGRLNLKSDHQNFTHCTFKSLVCLFVYLKYVQLNEFPLGQKKSIKC